MSTTTQGHTQVVMAVVVVETTVAMVVMTFSQGEIISVVVVVVAHSEGEDIKILHPKDQVFVNTWSIQLLNYQSESRQNIEKKFEEVNFTHLHKEMFYSILL